MEKICSKCGEKYSAKNEEMMNRFFSWQNKEKRKLVSQCKKCVRKRTNEYNKSNREVVNEQKAKWHEENKDYTKETRKVRNYYASICTKNVKQLSEVEMLEAINKLQLRIREMECELDFIIKNK